MPTLQETSLMVSDWDTWEKTLDPAKRQQLDSVFRFETDKIAARQRFAAVAHVSAATGADIEDVSRRFESWYMPAFAVDAKVGFNKPEGVKDSGEFFGLLKGRADTLKIRNELFTDAAGAALESVLMDGNALDDFATWQAGQDHEDAYGDKALEVWKKAREEAQAKLGADGLAIAKRGVRAMRTETGVAQEGDAWMNEARRDLIRVKAENPAKYNLILGAMTRLGKAAPKGDKGVVEGMGEQAGRVLGDMATGVADLGTNMMRDASASLAEAGITNAENPEALAAQIRAGRDVDIDLEDLEKGVIDPIKSERDGWTGWIENAAYGLSSSAPIMAAARNPLGQLALAGMFADESYNDFRRAGWTGAGAAGAAVASGVFQTGVEYVSELAIKIPGVAGVMAKFGVKPGSSWAAQFFMRSGIRAGTELGEEAVQQAANPFIQELGAVITQAIPDRPEGQKLKDVMGEFMKADQFMPLTLSVLPLGMMGAGMSTSQDMAVINAVTSNDKLLRAVFSEEDTAAIIAEADPAKRQAMIQEKWVATPIPEIVERARAVMEEETNTLTEAREALATMEAAPFFLMPIVKRDENGWLVRYRGQGSEAESVVRVANKEAAVSLAYDGYDENVRTEARAMVDTLEAFAGATDIFEVDLANERLLKDTGISEEEMTKAAIAEGIINGLTREEAMNITWAVHGQNRLEQVEGVRRVVSNLARGANVLDAVEEPIEGKFMAAIKQGRLTRKQAIAWVKVAADAMNAPELVTAAESNERGLIEAVSDVVLADVFGKRKDGSKAAQGAISAGIRAKIRRGEAGKAETQLGQILASFRHFFGQVFKRARQLVKARKDGRIGEDFDSFLDTLMETDASVVYEAEAAREAVDMAGGIDNAPFSLAPRSQQDTDYLAAVERGDMVEAQRMVDEAAKAAGFNVGPVWHGTKGKLFTVFDPEKGSNMAYGPGFYFAESKERALLFGDNVITAFLKIDDLEELRGTGVRLGDNGYRTKLGDWVIKPDYQSSIKSADPVTRDDSGNVIPLSQRFTTSDDIRFSLAPRSLASVADTVLASKMKKPEFREALYRVAREKMDRLRSDGEWRVSKTGVASRRAGTDTLAAGDRAQGNIENERKFRLRSRQRELLDEAMNGLSPADRMALEKGTMSWADNPVLASIFEHGKLMSKSTAKRLGKFRPLSGDYDMAPGWLPPSMFAKGDAGYAPDQLAKEAFGDQALPDQLWDEIRRAMDEVTKGNQEARAAQQKVKEIEAAALKQARAESDAWAKEARAQVPTPKERQMAALRTLDAILSAFPAEIRGQVGGFVKLASLGSDKAREAEIVKRLEKLDTVVEKAAKKHYLEAIEGTLEKAKPKKGKAGEKPKGKLGANVQALVDLARTFSELDEVGVSAERAAIADRMSKEADPAKVADLFEREQLLDLFGALDERTSAELEAAAAWLADTYQTGRNRWRAVIEQREEQTREQRQQAREEIGLEGLDAEQQKALEEARTISKRAGSVALSWLSFEQVMTSILGRGSKLARDVVRQARAATTRKTDVMREKRAAFRATMASIFGTTKQREWQDKLWNLSQIGGVQVVKMEGARTEMRTVAVEALQRIIEGKASAKAFGLDALKLDKLADAWADNDTLPANRRKENLTFEVPMVGTATPTRLSQLQAVNITMLARQAGYTENMAGHGWTDEVLNEIEAQLTPEAKAIRDWLATEYRTGYDSLNEVYARMYGVNLPRLVNYSPGTFEAMDMMGQDIDPYGQGLLSEGGFRAGMLKTRGKHKAAPRLEDALSVYWSHVNATEHFKAFGEFARDLRGVMNNAEVRKSIKAKGGKDLLEAGQNWIGAFERNGVENRSTSSAFDEFIRRRQASQAYLALAYNVGTLMKQSTAALGSLLNMGPGAAARQFSKLVTGGLDLKAAYQSDVIQRRMDAGYSPEVRQAMAAMMAERPTWGTGLVQKGMEIIGMVDAVFTTASYAMAYDYHLQSAKDAGMNEAQSKIEAESEAEATVARTAQPSEMMDRSLFEMGLQPTGKFLFMFASEARQKAALALEAYSPSSGLSKGERATRLLLLHVVFPLAIQTITNLWRDAREDDDDELFDSDNWRAGDYAKAMLLGPLTGIPLVGSALNASLTPVFGGHYFPNDPTQPLNRALGGGSDILEAIQEGDLESGLKGARSLMWAVALAMGGEKAAAVGVGSNMLFDAFRVVENVTE